MGGVTKRGRDWVMTQARRAQAAGHDVRLEVRDRRDEFPQMGQHAIKHWAVCSCGWRSRPWARQAMALSQAMGHLGWVADEIEAEERRQAHAAAERASAEGAAARRTTA